MVAFLLLKCFLTYYLYITCSLKERGWEDFGGMFASGKPGETHSDVEASSHFLQCMYKHWKNVHCIPAVDLISAHARQIRGARLLIQSPFAMGAYYGGRDYFGGCYYLRKYGICN